MSNLTRTSHLSAPEIRLSRLKKGIDLLNRLAASAGTGNQAFRNALLGLSDLLSSAREDLAQAERFVSPDLSELLEQKGIERDARAKLLDLFDEPTPLPRLPLQRPSQERGGIDQNRHYGLVPRAVDQWNRRGFHMFSRHPLCCGSSQAGREPKRGERQRGESEAGGDLAQGFSHILRGLGMGRWRLKTCGACLVSGASPTWRSLVRPWFLVSSRCQPQQGSVLLPRIRGGPGALTCGRGRIAPGAGGAGGSRDRCRLAFRAFRAAFRAVCQAPCCWTGWWMLTGALSAMKREPRSRCVGTSGTSGGLGRCQGATSWLAKEIGLWSHLDVWERVALVAAAAGSHVAPESGLACDGEVPAGGGKGVSFKPDSGSLCEEDPLSKPHNLK